VEGAVDEDLAEGLVAGVLRELDRHSAGAQAEGFGTHVEQRLSQLPALLRWLVLSSTAFS
jgi:hypothetical protein